MCSGSPLIKHVLVLGQDCKALGALVWTDDEVVEELHGRRGRGNGGEAGWDGE